MLTLQTRTASGWQTVGAPYAPSDAAAVQRAAVAIFEATGALWRVLGEQGRVLSLWDGRRWHLAAEATTMPAEFWQQDADYCDTIPTR